MIPTIFWKRQNYKDSIKISGCQGLAGRDERIGRAQGIFSAMKLFCMILQWWECVIIRFSKPIDCTIPKMSPNVNYGLWVIMMCQCRFIKCNKHITQVWDVGSWEGCVCWGHGVCGNSLYFSRNFAVNLKLL